MGAGKTVTLTGATLTGSAAGNYSLTSVGTTTAAITALGITGSFTAADKVYDGTTSATVLTRTLNGVLAADTANVSLTGGTASFGDANVGAGKTVTLAGATLTGSAAGNYNLSSVGTTTAAITALGITGSFTAADKVYDGNDERDGADAHAQRGAGGGHGQREPDGRHGQLRRCERGPGQDGDAGGGDAHGQCGGQLQPEFGGHDHGGDHGAGDHGQLHGGEQGL